MSDLDNQDEHKARVQNRARSIRAGVLKDGTKPLTDIDDQQDNKSSSAPNLDFPRVLKKPGGKNEV